MRVIGSRDPSPVRRKPSGAALKAGAVHQATATALAAVPTTGIRKGVYRFRSQAEANRHAEQAQTRAIARNLLARRLVS